ncbi:MAG: hypothetical protein R3C29_03190 [Dehalococcoidia bacterium]
MLHSEVACEKAAVDVDHVLERNEPAENLGRCGSSSKGKNAPANQNMGMTTRLKKYEQLRHPGHTGERNGNRAEEDAGDDGHGQAEQGHRRIDHI